MATITCRLVPRIHTSHPSYLKCALSKCPISAFTPSSHNSRPSKEHVLNFLSFISPICEKYVSLFLPVKKVLLDSISLCSFHVKGQFLLEASHYLYASASYFITSKDHTYLLVPTLDFYVYISFSQDCLCCCVH